jgi:hypothetical protein
LTFWVFVDARRASVQRIGLLNTMVFAHLPANLLLARAVLSQMDVPARQAYVVTMVDPGEHATAAAHTNTARYAAQPAAPLIAGGLRVVYDLILYSLFRSEVLVERGSPGTGNRPERWAAPE